MPTEYPVMPAQRKCVFPWLAAPERCFPFLTHAGQFGSIVNRFPTPTELHLRGQTRVLVPTIVVPNNCAVRFCHPRQLRNRIGKLLKPAGGVCELLMQPGVFQRHPG